MSNSEKISKIVKEITFKSVQFDEPLFSSGLIDSMGAVDLASLLEIEFNCKIEAREIIPENFDSISKMVVFLDKKKQR